MRQRTKKPTLKVKKETVRVLAARALSELELAQVGGGGTSFQPRYSWLCR